MDKDKKSFDINESTLNVMFWIYLTQLKRLGR